MYSPSVPYDTLQAELHRLRNLMASTYLSPLNTNCEIMSSYTDVRDLRL